MPAASRDQQVPRSEEVFISYSRKDKEFVRRLDEELKRRDREAWVDWEGIPPGDTWEKTIYGAIESTHTFIFVLTPDSIASEVCGKEIAHAAANNKRLVPIVYRDVAADKVPKSLGELNWIFCRDSDDFNEATDTLIRALDTDLKWVRAHTRLLTRAIEWEANGRNNSFVLRGEDLRSAERWLAEAGAQKERQPTALQTEYVIASRKASARRQRITLGAVSFGFVVAIGLAVLAWGQRTKAIKNANEADRQKQEAVKQEAKAKEQTKKVSQSLSRSDFFEATRRLSQSETGAAMAHLARALRTDPGNKDAQSRLISLLSQRNWQFPALEPLVANNSIWSAEFSPDGKRIVTTSDAAVGKGIVQVWNAETTEKVGESFSCTPPITVTFNSDGGRIAVMWDIEGDAKASSYCQMLDGLTGQPIGNSTDHVGTLRTSGFSKDGKRLLLGYDLGNGAGEVCVRDAIVGGPLKTLLTSKDAVPEAFDAAGTMVVTLGIESGESDPEKRKIARVWNLTTRKPITNELKHDQELKGAIFSSEGDQIATRSFTQAFVWNLATNSLIAHTQPLADPFMLYRMRYSPDAKLLLIVGAEHPTREVDWIAQLCDAKTGALIPGGEIRDHGRLNTTTFSLDSQFLLLSSSGHRARVWRTRSGTQIEAEEATAPLEHADVVSVAEFSPDGKRILTASFDKTLRLWHATPGLGRALPEKIPTAQPVWFGEASPDGSRIVLGSQNPDGLQIFDGDTLQPRSQFIPQAKLVPFVFFSGDSHLLAAANEDGVATILDASDGRFVSQLKDPAGEAITRVKLDATGTRAATAAQSGAMLWDVPTLRGTRLAPMSNEPVSGIEFSPDGTRLVTVQDSELNMWDARNGAKIWGPLPHAVGSGDVSFSPDGTRFALCGSERVVDVRETMTGKCAYLLQHNGIAVDAKFSPDGKRIATCSFVMKTSGYVQVWDAATGAAITQPLTGGEEVHRVAFSPDGELVAGTERGNGVRIWSIATGRECFDLLPQSVWHCAPSFVRDGKHLLTVADGVGYLHELWIPSEDAPPWLSDLAESIGGFSVNASGVVGLTHDPVRKLNEVRATVARAQDADPLVHWARWFLADRRMRTISPDSKITVGGLETRLSKPAEPKLTDQGDAATQFNLGVQYERGRGVPKDLGKAAELYQKAADQGNAHAQNNLGSLYQNGRGVPKDLGKASELYQKAADQGNAAAQNNLGVLYRSGQGVPKDLGKAAELYQKAADQRNAFAQNNLGWLCENGWGVPKDLDKATQLYRKAANQGNQAAIANLKRLSGETPKPESTARPQTEAMATGYVPSETSPSFTLNIAPATVPATTGFSLIPPAIIKQQAVPHNAPSGISSAIKQKRAHTQPGDTSSPIPSLESAKKKRAKGSPTPSPHLRETPAGIPRPTPTPRARIQIGIGRGFTPQ